MARFVLVLALCLAVAGSASKAAKGALRHVNKGNAEGFVRALEFKHRLRVCNAYPYPGALDVYRGDTEKLNQDPMPYKNCKDFLAPLRPGDKLEFRVGDANAGTFSVADLPNNDAVLLLIIHRHDTLSTAVSFESHVFANLLNAQVAVIDTYKGSARSKPRIMDTAGGKFARSEELRYDSIVAVNPGVYEVELAGDSGLNSDEVKARSELVAINRESYVVLRTGIEAQQGQSYPQELVVYPKSDVSMLHSGAAKCAFPAALLALGFGALF